LIRKIKRIDFAVNISQVKEKYLKSYYVGMGVTDKGKLQITFPADTVASDIRFVLTSKESIETTTIRFPGSKKFEKMNGAATYRNNNYALYEYIMPKAKVGSYKIRIKTYDDYGDYYSRPDVAPKTVQLTIFRNYGKPGQTIEQQYIIIDNQQGEYEIADIKSPPL